MENGQEGSVVAFPKKEPPKSVMETKILTLVEMNGWALPPFQRDEIQNKRVVEFAEELRRDGGSISGVIHLGHLKDDPRTYLVDGQQRRGGCNLSGLDEFIVDVSTKLYESMKEMAEDFKKINGRLVPLRPDDMLRAYEMSNPDLQQLRVDCSFIGYSNVRRCERGVCLSMGATLRCWFGSAMPTPACQGDAISLLKQLNEVQRQYLTVFLSAAHKAWGFERENFRLYSNLNLLMCMYSFRKLVLEPNNRRAALPAEMFYKCLLSVAADGNYSDWLQGRNVTERDRAPCYNRLKRIFMDRLRQEYNGKLTFLMPKPTDWGK